MKRIALGMAMALSLMVSAAYADGPSNNINLFLGQKTLDSDDWALGYDEQAEIGLLCDFRGQDWPVSLAIELLGSTKEETFNGVDVTGSTSELCIGIKKIWEPAGTPIRPFVGGGLAAVYGEVEAVDQYDNSYSEDASGVGYYISGGLYVTLGEHLNLGALVRYSQAEVSVDDDGGDEYDLEAGGTHVGVFVGYHW